MNLDDLKLTESVCTMLFAEGGIGKTRLMGTAGSRNVIVSSGNGLVTLKNAEFVKAYPNTNPQVIMIPDDADPTKPTAYDTLRKTIDKYFETPALRDSFDYFSIDDASWLRLISRNRGMQLNSLSGKSQTIGKVQGVYKGDIVLTESDYGAEMDITSGFLDSLCGMGRMYGKHIIVCAHEGYIWRKEKNSTGTREVEVMEKIVPAFTGKKEPTKNNQYFDLVIRLTRVGKGASSKIVLQFHPDDLVAAKDRYMVFKMYEDFKQKDKVMDIPTIIKMIKALEPAVEVSSEDPNIPTT